MHLSCVGIMVRRKTNVFACVGVVVSRKTEMYFASNGCSVNHIFPATVHFKPVSHFECL